jgi:FtsP/CotA-like multicopper oxidase with cupredoxin domain
VSHITAKFWVAIAATVVTTLHGPLASAATPGITGQGGAATFDLSAEAALISQPDGQAVYSWGYGCRNTSASANFAPAAIPGPTSGCPTMQIPGPTLIVQEGATVAITLTNNLPAAAGNTSILFPGFTLAPFAAGNGVPGLLTQEAKHGQSVTYTFTATTPGTHSYYSGTQGDLQVEMGLYGAIVVLPTLSAGVPDSAPTSCHSLASNLPDGQTDYRLASAAYNHVEACYDREYLFQFSEMDPSIHLQAEKQAALPCGAATGCMVVATEPYHPAYFMINGRSMPDDMDANYAPQYPHQPYNGNPHMHPGELTLVRVIGQGRWQHPFHEHGNHVRVLARDGNLLLAPTVAGAAPNSTTPLAGPLLFTTTTTPGVAMDGIFYWTGRGLNWDVYAHTPKCVTAATATTPALPLGCSTDSTAGVYTDTAPQFSAYLGKPVVCTPDVNGYYTVDPGAPNYYEWCQDHNKPLETHPFGKVGSGGPVTLPDPNYMTNGTWFGGSPYLGPDATTRATGPLGTTPPSGTVANPPSTEAGFAFMWHSHNEREITTNNIFPGGMMMMMLVDPQAFVINEAN